LGEEPGSGEKPEEPKPEEEKFQIKATLDCGTELILNAGEQPSKVCAIRISGFRRNTADRVYVEYPQQIDGWGNLPGKTSVWPATSSEDPNNMTGAGDYTKEYIWSEFYSASRVAKSGVFPIDIVVRQDKAGEARLQLILKVVAKDKPRTATTALYNMAQPAKSANQPEGAYEKKFTLTGIKGGPFNIHADVGANFEKVQCEKQPASGGMSPHH
jgi:hypothetical protein